MLKIGGSIITDIRVPKKAKVSAIRGVLMQIKNAKKKKNFDLIIGHGSGSFAHITAKKYRVHEGLINKNSRKGAAITHMVAHELNTILVNEAHKIGLDAFPFHPSSFGFWEGERAKSGIVEHMEEALKNGFIPVAYGDVVMNARKGVSIASTEDVFEFIAERLKPQKIILATDVDGVYDKDPKRHEDARLVKLIDSRNIKKVLGGAGGSTKVDVTGGMRTKLELLYRIAKRMHGEGAIVNGLRKGYVEKLLLGKDQVRHTEVKP